MRVVNGVVTLGLVPLLYNLFRKTNRRFYLYWGSGFLLYGINIMLRVVAPEIIVSRLTLFIFFLTTTGFILIVTGIGELVKRTRALLTATLILPVILLVQYVIGGDWQYLIWFIVLSPYMFIVLSLIVIMRVYSYDLKLLIVGWTNILILNMAFAFEMMNPGFVDLMSAVSKVVIFWGMTQPSFAFIVDDLNSFIMGGIATEYSEVINGQYSLVGVSKPSRDKEIEWIKGRIESNARKGIRTIFLSYYDMITPRDISLSEEGDDTYFVRVKLGSPSSQAPFEEKVMVINDDLSQLDILLTEIVNLSTDKQISSEVIIYSISAIIHTHGWKRLYTFITSKIPLIKRSSVNMVCFYFPESHEKRADVRKFETMADKVIEI